MTVQTLKLPGTSLTEERGRPGADQVRETENRGVFYPRNRFTRSHSSPAFFFLCLPTPFFRIIPPRPAPPRANVASPVEACRWVFERGTAAPRPRLTLLPLFPSPFPFVAAFSRGCGSPHGAFIRVRARSTPARPPENSPVSIERRRGEPCDPAQRFKSI